MQRKIAYLLFCRTGLIKNFTFEVSIFLKFHLQMVTTKINVYSSNTQNNKNSWIFLMRSI